MRPEAFDTVESVLYSDHTLLKSRQRSKRVSSILRFTALSALAAAVVGPQLVLAIHAMANDEVRAQIMAQPLVAVELTLAFAFWIGLFGWPLKRLLDRVNGQRDVEITPENVAVRDDRVLGLEQWTAPLADYTGITHRIRSSLSGTRHELILVHPDPERSVLLMVAEHILDRDIHQFAHLLGRPILAAPTGVKAGTGATAEPQNAPSQKAGPLAIAA